jgi:hypothetical protein
MQRAQKLSCCCDSSVSYIRLQSPAFKAQLACAQWVYRSHCSVARIGRTRAVKRTPQTLFTEALTLQYIAMHQLRDQVELIYRGCIIFISVTQTRTAAVVDTNVGISNCKFRNDHRRNIPTIYFERPIKTLSPLSLPVGLYMTSDIVNSASQATGSGGLAELRPATRTSYPYAVRSAPGTSPGPS